ncbi:MAG TPA: hypothetical protein VGE63_02280 [Candidatus Paceibacterota bacterium]
MKKLFETLSKITLSLMGLVAIITLVGFLENEQFSQALSKAIGFTTILSPVIITSFLPKKWQFYFAKTVFVAMPASMTVAALFIVSYIPAYLLPLVEQDKIMKGILITFWMAMIVFLGTFLRMTIGIFKVPIKNFA